MAEFEDYLNEQLTGEEEAPQEEVVAEPTPVEPVAAETEQEVEAAPQPRDEQGRFAKNDNTDKRLADKDRFIGQLQRELEEARQQYQPQPPQDFGDVESIIDANPEIASQIALRAIQSGDVIGYERIIHAWHESDPLAASRFDARFQAAQMQAQLQQQLQPSLQSAEQMQIRQANEAAVQQLSSQYADFANVVSRLDPESDDVPPILTQMLGDPQMTSEALELMYAWAKLRVGDQINAEAQAQQAAQAEQVHREKTQAAVASASPPPASEGTGDPFVDSLFAEFRKPSPFSTR